MLMMLLGLALTGTVDATSVNLEGQAVARVEFCAEASECRTVYIVGLEGLKEGETVTIDSQPAPQAERAEIEALQERLYR